MKSAKPDDLLQEAAHRIRTLRSLLDAHESKEEEILTPILRERLDPETANYMKEQEGRISELLQELGNTVQQLSSGHGISSNHSMTALVEQFEALIRQHFSHEENVLFWFASLHINRT